jgi:hypothetical protein
MTHKGYSNDVSIKIPESESESESESDGGLDGVFEDDFTSFCSPDDIELDDVEEDCDTSMGCLVSAIDNEFN